MVCMNFWFLGYVRVNGTKLEVNDCSYWMLIVTVGDGMCTTNGTSFTEIGEWPFRRFPINYSKETSTALIVSICIELIFHHVLN